MSKPKTKAPLQTLAEDTYLRQLAAKKVPITVKMHSGKLIEGTLEIFDADILRVAQAGAASAFLYKEEIKYLWETPTEA